MSAPHLAREQVALSSPKRTDGDRENAFPDAQEAGAGVEYGARYESVAEFGVQPFEVPCVFAGWSSGSFDLDGEDVAGGDLGDQVDLVPALLVA
jgi:hypothetical protein